MNPQPKHKPYRNKKILKAAKGHACTLTGPTCNHNPETTVWAHLNESFAGKGLGQKADDHAGFLACSSCHNWYDQRDPGQRKPEYFEILRAVVRSLGIMLDDGILK